MSKQNAALKEAPPKEGEGYRYDHVNAAHMRVVDADRGVVAQQDGQPRRKKIALCGFASSTRKYILHFSEDPAWEIWGLNQLYRHIPRGDRWFDIHHNWDKEIVPGTDHREWARTCGIPFYTLERQLDLPTNVRFPMEAVLDIYKVDYFTSTIPYMLSLALLEIDAHVMEQTRAHLRGLGSIEALGSTHIADVIRSYYNEWTVGLFGIDLVVEGEYFHEKPCAEFWLGMLSARGITVAIPPESALCKQQQRYGSAPPAEPVLTPGEVAKHTAALRSERDEQLKRLYMLEGAMEANTRWEQVLTLRERGAQAG